LTDCSTDFSDYCYCEARSLHFAPRAFLPAPVGSAGTSTKAGTGASVGMTPGLPVCKS